MEDNMQVTAGPTPALVLVRDDSQTKLKQWRQLKQFHQLKRLLTEHRIRERNLRRIRIRLRRARQGFVTGWKL